MLGRIVALGLLGISISTAVAQTKGLPSEGAALLQPDSVEGWTAADVACRRDLPALAAIAACEQRDVLGKRLIQRGYCVDKLAWRRCDSVADRAPSVGAAYHTVGLPFARVGAVISVPILLNDRISVNALIDSGATHMQIPEDVVNDLRKSGALADTDFLGQRRYTLADGRGVQQRIFRLKLVGLGTGEMDNVIASIGAAWSKPLIGQSFLRRLAGWRVDNINTRLELYFAGPRTRGSP